MTAHCDAPVSEDELLDYWIGALAAADAERIEEHLFSCGGCHARLEAITSLGAGLVGLVRRGRVSGVVSRSLLNRLQRDGVQIRLYSMSPGERVPCAAFPGDDLLVLALRADFAGSGSVSLSIAGPDDALIEDVRDIPVCAADPEILWATPGEAIRNMPTARFRVTVTSGPPGGALLAEYELDHTRLPRA